MSLNNPLTTFGVKTAAFYNPRTGETYGMSRYFDSHNLDASGATQNLMTGAYQAPVKAVTNERPSTIGLTLSHLETWMWLPFFGRAAASIPESANPAVTALSGIRGANFANLTIAISGMTANMANAKFGKYLIRFITDTTYNIYGLVDADQMRGVDITYQDDTLKLLASDQTISATAEEIASLGITVAGTGTFAVGDTALFSVYPAITEGFVSEVNATLNCPEIGMVVSSELASDGTITLFDYPRVVSMGAPLNIARKDFQRPEFSFQAVCQANGRIYEVVTARIAA